MGDVVANRALGDVVEAFRREWAAASGGSEWRDDELQQQQQQHQPKRARSDDAAAPTKPKRLAWVAYAVLSDEKLDEQLRSLGLVVPPNATRDAKVELHRAYLLAFNAEVDGGKTPDPGEVRRRVMGERAARTAAKFFHPAASASSSSSSAAETTPATTSSSSFDAAAAEEPASISRARAAFRRRDRSKWTWTRVPTEWRAMWSDALDRPVYFNTRTKEVTTVRPEEATQEDYERGNSRVVVVSATEKKDDAIVLE